MSNLSVSSSESLHICDFYSVKVKPDGVDIFTAVVNLAFSVSAILGNALVLVAIRRTTSLWMPTKILLSSLALADLFVGILVQPLFVMKILLEADRLPRCVIGVLFDFFSGHLSIASFTTMMLISIDKCMAAHLKMRYRTVVTRKRSILAVTFIWVYAIPSAISYFVSLQFYCIFIVTVIPVCFLISLVAFAKIRFVLRRQGKRYSATANTKNTRPTRQSGRPTNMPRYRSSVRSMLYVYCAQVIAYCPAWLVMVIRVLSGTNPMIQAATQLTLTFVFLNSTVNPVLYLWRIKELRATAAEVIPCILKPVRVNNKAETPTDTTTHHTRTRTFVESVGA